MKNLFYLPSEWEILRFFTFHFSLFTLPDSPFSRIEVVCPVADVLGKTERMSLIGDEHIAFGCVGWQLQCFCAKIGDGLLFIYFCNREDFFVEAVAHGEALAGAK